ncbi:MAG: DUF5916 domain-containing protein [Gemmatimonadota bacterium]
MSLIPSALILAAALQAGGLSDDSEPSAPTPKAESTVPATTVSHDGSALQLDILNPWFAQPALLIDGRLDEAAWAEAPLLHGFTQFEPLEGVPATQRTEVRVLVSDDALYLAVEAWDQEAGGIRATLAKRDSYGRSDDYVRFVLDTFNDQRRAFVFQVNPLGVQGDGLWLEGGRGGGGGGAPVDWNPDFVWESAGQVLPDRYVVELRIPFKSLRFPADPLQDWGFQVVRRIQRNGYEESWAPLTNDQANRLAQSGRLVGLRDLDPGLFLEVNPVVTASRSGALDAEGAGFQPGPIIGDFGLNVTYGLTSNLTLDGTYNPDFSQVEADAGQITVNERFAVFLPEKRPFFLEGTDVFAMPKQLVYTRSIANPVGAAKVSGKVGNLSVAYVGAVDQVGSDGNDPVVNLVRLKQDVGASSTVGLAYTDRTRPGADFNRVVGADGRFVMGGRYTLNLLAAASADGAVDNNTDVGSLLVARFGRSGRSFGFDAGVEDVTSDFRAGSGFIRRVGYTQLDAGAGYTWRGKRGALLESLSPSIGMSGFWDRDAFWAGGGPVESQIDLGAFVSLRGNVGAFLSVARSSFANPAADYEGLFLTDESGTAEAPFAPGSSLFRGLDAVRVRGWVNSWERVRLNGGASWSETPIFDRALGLPADRGQSWSGDLNVAVYPTASLTTEVGLRHVRLVRDRDGSVYSTATLPRLQARYQFSRALFLRAIAEYASQERGPVRDPSSGLSLSFCADGVCSLQDGSSAYDVSVEALLGYEPSPGTVLFAGYSRQMRDSLGFRFRDLATQADGLFVKVSYRLRM